MAHSISHKGLSDLLLQGTPSSLSTQNPDQGMKKFGSIQPLSADSEDSKVVRTESGAMFRKLAYIGDIESANNNARLENFQEKNVTGNVKKQQPQSSGMMTKLNYTRLDTKVWSRDSVEAEDFLLLVP